MSVYERYLAKVKFHLRVDKKTKNRIIDGLRTEMEYAIENGESSDELFKRMGSPEEMARSYNNTYKKDPDYQKRKRYRIAKAISLTSLIITAIAALAVIIVGVSLMDNYSVSQIGGVSGPTTSETVNTPLTFLDLIRSTGKYIAIPIIVFVSSTIYCLIEKIQNRKRLNHEKD